MRLGNTASIEELQAVSRYDGLRQSLFAKRGAGQLDKPLSYWALPTDRCLPLALLDRSLRDILNILQRRHDAGKPAQMQDRGRSIMRPHCMADQAKRRAGNRADHPLQALSEAMAWTAPRLA